MPSDAVPESGKGQSSSRADVSATETATVAVTDTIASHLPAQTNAKTASDFPTLETHFLRLATIPPLFLLAFAPFAFFVAESLRVSA